MAFFKIPNVKIAGISACVPALIEENTELTVFKEGEAERVIASTGIERKRVVEDGVTPSDLCVKAAEKLLSDLKWEKEEIDCLIYVCTNRDYLQPMTACVIHQVLALKKECYVLDIPCGCPGWLYGLNVIASLLNSGDMKKGLLLVGDTSTRMNYPKDKSTRPLFGDAGTATALTFEEGSPELQFYFATDGKGCKEIITEDGGARNPFSLSSLKEKVIGEGIVRRSIDCGLNGMNVFSFSITEPPVAVTKLIEHNHIDPEKIDYLFLHQANRYIVDKIRKKLKFPSSKVPCCLKDFGNTSSASIPLTIVTQCREEFRKSFKNNLACAFGTGLMWGALHFKTDRIVCSELVEY